MTPTKKTPNKPLSNGFKYGELDPMARILRFPKCEITNFQGLIQFPNLRILDMRGNSFSFSRRSILVAFRSYHIQMLNGTAVSEEEIKDSFRYSSIITYALRQGFGPELDDDEELCLQRANEFLRVDSNANNISIENGNPTKISILFESRVYSWSVLDENFCWKNIDHNAKTYFSHLNYPIRCVTKGKEKDNQKSGIKSIEERNRTFIIPEFDLHHHFNCDIQGDCIEGSIINVRAPLYSQIKWSFHGSEEIVLDSSLVFPLTSESVDRVVVCSISLYPFIEPTIIMTEAISPADLRFSSLSLQGQLIENNEISFNVSTRGCKSTFKGIKILRSARHGEWENVTTLEDREMKYHLSVFDIGCVIRAVCLTEGEGPKLMLTSSERVQPSTPSFRNPKILGNGSIGSPLFAIAEYNGGIQGSCRYEWNIGPSGPQLRPVVVPTSNDKKKIVTCKMIPVRSDGAIGSAVEARFEMSGVAADTNVLEERFLEFHKKTKSGKLQMSFIEEPQSKNLFQIKEGETLIVRIPCEWVVVHGNSLHSMQVSKTFTAPGEFIKGIVVLFTETFFVIVGQIEACDPVAKDLNVKYDPGSSFLSLSYEYSGGIEGRSIVQWNRKGKDGISVAGFGKSLHIGMADSGSYYTACITPCSIDGKKGETITSDPYYLCTDSVINEIKPPLQLSPPDSVYELTQIAIIKFGVGEIPSSPCIMINDDISKRYVIRWTEKNKVRGEGLVFTPLTSDIGKVFFVKVIDRLTGNSITECTLPKVEALEPQVSNVELLIDESKLPINKDNPIKRLIVKGEYIGGIEGNSVIIWKARAPNDSVFKDVKKSDKKWLEIDQKSYGGYFFKISYLPINKECEIGTPVESNEVLLPLPPKIEIVDIQKASIIVDDEYRNFTCVIETNDKPGSVAYCWGYNIDGVEHMTDLTDPSRPISGDDFDYIPFCRLQALGPNGEYGSRSIVYLSKTMEELFTPEIISPVVKSDHEQYIVGTTLTVDYQYSGPPITDTQINWERMNRIGEWELISSSPSYRPHNMDVDMKIRAVVTVDTVSEFSEECSTTNLSEPVHIMPNSSIVKFANSLRRTKAIFEAKLSVGDPVTVILENGMFSLKAGTRVMMKTQINNVVCSVVNGTESNLSLKASHGYSTELVFASMKMQCGTKLPNFLTRDLFIEVIKKHKQ